MSIVVPETRPPKSRGKNNASGGKKKLATPRATKKKKALATASMSTAATNENSVTTRMPSNETTTEAPLPTAKKGQISGTESEDFDEKNDAQQQQQLQAINSKSGDESDGIVGTDHSVNAPLSTTTSSSAVPEKKAGRTTIKAPQLEVNMFVFITFYLFISFI